MSERGVFAVDRGIFDHQAFANEPFTQREAWIWLVGEAAWKDRTRRIGSLVVNLKRGQSASSLRYMADTWGWHYSAVRRFLKRLETETMIATATEQGIFVITICKYNEYQRVALPSATETETPIATGPQQDRNKTENIKNIEVTRERVAGEKPISDSAYDLVAEIFEATGTDKDDVSWSMGLPWLVQSWLNLGCSRDFILNTIMTRLAGRKIPNTKYLDKVIRSAWAERDAKPMLVPGGKDAKADSIGTAIGGLRAKLADFNRPPPGGICGGESGTVVRLLPQGGRERS